jgi:hypothetical protein
MRCNRKLKFVRHAVFLLSLCPVAGYAEQTGTPLAKDMPSSKPDSENQTSGSSGKPTTVTITAPRPRTQTPGMFSLDGLSLASPLSQGYAPGLPPATGYFAGMTNGMPHKLLLGSAPSPTPDDLCAYGSDALRCFTDSSRQERRHYIADPLQPGHFREVRPGDEKIVENQLQAEKLARQHMFWMEK